MMAAFRTPSKSDSQKRMWTVKRKSTTGERTSFTVLEAIPSAGEKWPLWVSAKNRMLHCGRKFGPYPRVIGQHSESGWATENVIVEFIESLHREVADCKPCALVLNIDPSHRTQCVIAAAKEIDVKFLSSRPVEPVIPTDGP
jgi:hypothetical protein